MVFSWESEWAEYLKLDRSDLSVIERNSALENPLGFLLFLDKVSREKDLLKLPLEKLICLKNVVLLGETFIIKEQQSPPKASCFQNASSCSLCFTCNSDVMHNFPRHFDSNDEIEDAIVENINLGNDKMTHSMTEGRNTLWDREFPPAQSPISQTRFIPKEFLDKIINIPEEFKDSFGRVIKQVISSCERFSNAITNRFKHDGATERLLKTMEWGQTLVDIWQFSSGVLPTRESLWKQEDWLDTLVAPLFKDGADPDSNWTKVRNHLGQQATFNAQSLLEKGQKRGKRTKTAEEMTLTRVQQKNLKSFLQSSKLILATFFVGQALGLASPQSESLVQKNGTLIGDVFEKDVFKVLKDVKDKYPKWITIFCGLEVLGVEQCRNEFDFLIFLGQAQTIIYVECKYTLRDEIAKKIQKQSANAFHYLKKHLPVKEGWEFLTWACYEEQTQCSICSSCQPFLVTISTLGTALDQVMKGNDLHTIDDEAQRVYENLVKTYLFHASTNKQLFESDRVSKHQLKTLGFPSQDIILWNLNQLTVLQKDPRRMILKSHGTFGTGKTELLKTKMAKLAEKPRNCVAFLAARKSAFAYTNALLLTKWLQFQFRLQSNVKAAELKPGQKIEQVLIKMFPDCHKDPNQIHVFIDEASKDNRDQIFEFLASLPKESENIIWIVDKDAEEMEIPPEQDFVIEKGLVLNLRNSEDVQNTIPFIAENQSPFLDYDDEEVAQRMCVELKKEHEAKQILILAESAKIALKIRDILAGEELHVMCYGFHQTGEDCSDADLDKFWDATNHEESQILVTKEDLVEGIESQMVLFHELHDVDDGSTHFRAKAILRTGFLNQIAHPALHRKYQVPILKADDEEWTRSVENFDEFEIDRYAKLVPGPEWTNVLSYIYYYYSLDEFRAEYLDRHPKLGRKTTIKQYNVIQEKSNKSDNFSYPLLLRLQIPDEWRTSYWIELKGQPVPKGHPLASRLEREVVDVVELVLSKLVWKWSAWGPKNKGRIAWSDILIAEIFRSYRLNVDLAPFFDFHRLFSMWSRIWEELNQNQLHRDSRELDSESYDRFRKDLLDKCLKIRVTMAQSDLHKIITILASYVTDPQFGHWSLIKILLSNLLLMNQNFGQDTPKHRTVLGESFGDMARSAQVATDPSMESYWEDIVVPDTTDSQSQSRSSRLQRYLNQFHKESDIAKLRQQLKKTGNFEDRVALSKLHMPLVDILWQESTFVVWRKVLFKNFPHCVQESWFQELTSFQKQLEVRKDDLIQARGSKSLFIQPMDELVESLEQQQPSDKTEVEPILTAALIFLVRQPNCRHSKWLTTWLGCRRIYYYMRQKSLNGKRPK
ncbi:uncharacterized protein LOC131892086 [Tigriopus californicus]|uniref:uncharacterized protein LOC131892086 n=1 Tax=Tigriopus californicus TaxID=6832 RepID=UPI0027DA4410|nr:uncharacterized protein LOC131892086 [Tigriopus californicus]